MLWVKSFTSCLWPSWFAGLFYLPRIFVNLAMVAPESVAERRLLLMARKLYRFHHDAGGARHGFGLWLWWLLHTIPAPVWPGPAGWWHAKLAVGRCWPSVITIWRRCCGASSPATAAQPCLVPLVQRSAGADAAAVAVVLVVVKPF